MSSVIATSARRLLATCAAAGFLLVGCSSDDSPTRPQQQPSAPGSSTAATFSVTLSSSASQLLVSSTEQADITITVRRTDNNQLPPNGAVVQVVTTLGTFSDGSQAVNAVLNNGVARVTLVPGAVEGTATVQASIQDSFAQLQISIRDSSTFFAGNVTPNTGIPGGGETVTITGQGFERPIRVDFIVLASIGSGEQNQFITNATLQSATEDTLIVTTPPSPVSVNVNETVTVDIRVTNRAGTQQESQQVLSGAFLYSLGGSILQPAVTSLSPANGPNEGGTRVRILGDGFEQPIQVLFGSGSVTAFTGLEAVVETSSRNELTVISPAAQGVGLDLRNSTVSLLVRNKNSGFATVVSSAFRYGFLGGVTITSFAPGQAEYNSSGDLVTIFGAGFDEPVAASLAGVAMPVISVTGSEVVVRTVPVVPTGCTDVSGPVSVTNIETGDQGTSGSSFIFRVFEPFIAGVAPNTGPEAGGIAATISGSQFESPSRVVFSNGGAQASAQIQNITDTSISVIVPAFPGELLTEPCDDNGDGTEGERMIPTPVTITVESVATSCTDSFQGGFIYNPANTSCDEAPVEPPPAPTAAFSFFIVSGSTVQFTNGSSEDVVTYAWDFTNDGTIDSTAENPQFTFPGPGTYATRLRVTSAGGFDEIVQQVTIP